MQLATDHVPEKGSMRHRPTCLGRTDSIVQLQVSSIDTTVIGIVMTECVGLLEDSGACPCGM